MNCRIALLLFFSVFTASTDGLAREASLRAFEALDLSGANTRAPEAMQIRAFGRLFSLELTPNAELMAALPARRRERATDGDVFLKGSLSGRPGSWVRLNRIDGQFSGGFFDGRELYLIDSAAGLVRQQQRAAADDATIVFRFSDLELPIHIDEGAVATPSGATADATADYGEFVTHLQEVAALEGDAMFAMPVTIVSDVEFSNRHGSNTASVVLGRINFIDGIYSNQLGVGIALWHHEILSSNGSLTATDSSELLGQFRTFMTGGDGSALPFKGLAHLLTGRNLDGGTVGIAYLNVLCSNSFGFGVDQNLSNDTTSALVLAHELGHNFAARHDNDEESCPAETIAGIMSSSINGSQKFSDCSLAAMGPALDDAAACLVETATGEAVFADGFEP